MKYKRKFKDCLFYIFTILKNILGFFIPINPDLVLFTSFPDYSDNARAMSDFLRENTSLKIIWIVHHFNKAFANDNRIKFINRNSKIGKIKEIYYSLRAKYLFSTHGAFLWSNPNRQIYVCLWHGTPLKRIAKMQSIDSNKHFLEHCNIFLSPSKFYNNIIAQSFGKKENNILTLGYPRNDFLFRPTDCLQKLDINKNGNKLIFYLPTFRQPKGGGYQDSSLNVYKEGFINYSNLEDLIEWNEFLKKKSIIMIIKPHPSDSISINIPNLSNLILIPHYKLIDYDIQLYQLLYYSDALITDYSSVFCDYLCLNRPIGFILSDLDEYGKKRGFVFKNPLNMLPGKKILTKSDFINFLEDLSNNIDPEKEIREKLTPIYNESISKENCKVLWNKVSVLKNAKSGIEN